MGSNEQKPLRKIKLNKTAKRQVDEALAKGDKVTAIKIVLAAGGGGLGTSKSYVDSLIAEK